MLSILILLYITIIYSYNITYPSCYDNICPLSLPILNCKSYILYKPYPYCSIESYNNNICYMAGLVTIESIKLTNSNNNFDTSSSILYNNICQRRNCTALQSCTTCNNGYYLNWDNTCSGMNI